MVQAYLQIESGSNFNSTTGLLSNGSAVLLFDSQDMFNSSNEFQISIAGKWTHSNRNNLFIFSLANKNDSTAGYSCYTHSQGRTSSQFGYVRNDNGNADTSNIIKDDTTDLVDADRHFSVKFTQGTNSVSVQGYNVSEDGYLSALGGSTSVRGTGNPKLNKIAIEASANFKPNLYSIQILSGLGDFAGHYIAKEARTFAGTKIQLRHDTAANWTAVNPILAAGEMGVETDTNKFKFGDGTTAWSSLAYATSGSSGGGSGTQLTSADGTTEYGKLALGDTLAVSNGVLNANLDSKQDKFNTLTPINLSIITKNVITSPLAFNESLGGYVNPSLPYYCTYFEGTMITNYNSNLQFFKDYGYVDIPYKSGQIASYSFSYGNNSGMHQGMSANNIAYGRWVGDNFDVIMLQLNAYNGRLYVYPSYEVDSSGNLLNPITINLDEKTMADGSRYPTVYGGNQNIFQIIDNKIYTYAPTNTGLRQAEIPSNAAARVSQITNILIIPYYRPDNNEGRGTDKQPIFVPENSKGDGTMLFDTGNVAYPDLFPTATQSTWSTLFENAFANKNILLQGETSKEYLVLKYDNKTLEVNESGQLTCTSSMLSDSNFINFCTANAGAIKAALGLN